MGVSASPVKAGRVWALVEASEGAGLYRSEDFGETWALLNAETKLRARPWYYMHVFADTQDPETVYVNNQDMWRSTDAGKTFERIGTPHGDNHDLWIDPRDNQRMVQSNDGGANVSFNAGESWSTVYNQLTAQFYTVTTDNREPYYRVYGTQQDNTSLAVPSGATDGAIVWGDSYSAGTGESGFMAVHPNDPNIVFVGAVGSSPGGGGSLQRYDHRSGQVRLVSVWPESHVGIGPGELAYRFPWTFPILFSPHDPNILYSAGNVVFRTTDEGHSWKQISPDLTRNDASKLAVSGGPITKDSSGAEHYCTIATLRECSLEPGVLWAGSDDGLVHVSRDDGSNWENVTPPELPEWTFIRTIEPSPHTAGTVYMAATRYKLDDNTPYLYRTEDYGQTWQSIVGEGETAMPESDFVRVIRTDPAREGLLYVGTETGLFLSTDDGATWERWQSNLPVTPIYDLTVKGSDLVVATHGRSFWIMDDLTPLHQLMDSEPSDSVRLFQPRHAWRILPSIDAPWVTTEGKDYWVSLGKAATFHADKDETGQVVRTFADAGQSGPAGVVVYYTLGDDGLDDADSAVTLEFLDMDGQVVKAVHPRQDGYAELSDDEKSFDSGPWIVTKPGVCRFVWDLRYEGSTKVLGNKLAGEADVGPLVVPGTYQARLKVVSASGDIHTLTQGFEVVNDPRVEVSLADLRAQLEALLRIRDKISEAHIGVIAMRSVRRQLEAWMMRSDMGDDHLAMAGSLIARLDMIEDELMARGEHKDTFGLNERSRLAEKLASVISIVASADAAPTKQSLEVAAMYSEQIDEQLGLLKEVLETDLAQFNVLMSESDLPAIEQAG